MTIQRPSPGNSVYAPLIMVGLWGLHGLIIWYLSQDLALVLWAIVLSAVGTVLTQWFLRPHGSRSIIWRPGLFAFSLCLTWAFWAILNVFWNIEAQSAVIWPLIGFISVHDNERRTRRKRRARDIGV